MPRATSSEIDPVGITSIGARLSSPSRMIEPRPNCRSIWARAVSKALSLSPTLAPGLSMPAMDTPAGIKGLLVGDDATRHRRQNFDADEQTPDRAAASFARPRRYYLSRTVVRSRAGHAHPGEAKVVQAKDQAPNP